MSDGGLDDLFGVPQEPAEAVAVAAEKPRSRIPRIAGEALLIAVTTIVIVAGLRSASVSIPIVLIVASLIGLRVIMFAASRLAPPPVPRARSLTRTETARAADALRAAVRRWERNLDQAHSDPELYARNVLPVLAELTDERLRLRHGITRASDPRRARELLGEELWSALDEPGRRGLRARDVETLVNALERL
ncbi:hypothetical protein AB0M02_08560 [Actinoplanes sp. NPDC051861]|uniref:hypothetical protein n=1 Tax=Actinoplanes sp. NPDC051861 TaxID=3155170 RepID=UPI003433B2B5